MNFIAATSWESLLIFLVFIILSAVSNWMKRRNGGGEGEEETSHEAPAQRSTAPGSPQPAPQKAPAAVDWEKELRDMLGETETPAPKPAPPPPVVRAPVPVPQAAPRPVPPPLPAPPVRARSLSEMPAPRAPQSFQRAIASQEEARQLARKMQNRMSSVGTNIDKLRTGATAFLKGRQHPGAKPGQYGGVMHSQGAYKLPTQPELAQATKMFHSRQTTRQAMIASIILAPPKSLSND